MLIYFMISCKLHTKWNVSPQRLSLVRGYNIQIRLNKQQMQCLNCFYQLHYRVCNLKISSTIIQLLGRKFLFTLPVTTSAHSCPKVIKPGPFLTWLAAAIWTEPGIFLLSSCYRGKCYSCGSFSTLTMTRPWWILILELIIEL